MTNYNYEAFEKVLNAITKEPETFDMATWCSIEPCGTSMCLGGWACYLYDREQCLHEAEAINPGEYFYNNASKILGLTEDEAMIFSYENKEEDVLIIVESLVAEKNLAPDKQRTIQEISECLNINVLKEFAL